MLAKLEKIFILVNLVIALAGAGVVFYAHKILKPVPTDQAQEAKNLQTKAVESIQVAPTPIKKFVVNLHSKSSRLRYLDLEMNILTFTNQQKEIIKAKEYLFKDIVIETVSHLEPHELDTLSGKILLENKIKKQVNSKLGEPVVKQIFFSGFVVQ
jgi:flagellar FliL protein